MCERPRGAGKDSFSLIDAESLFAELRLEGSALFLDLASGPGSYALAAARRFPALGVQALDLAADLIAGLRGRAAAEGLTNLTATVADIRDPLPLADATVDACLMAMVVHDLVADRAESAVLREVRRVLKPAGRLAVVEFLKFPPPPGPALAVRLEPSELDAVLGRCGFRPVRSFSLGAKAYLSLFHPAA